MADSINYGTHAPADTGAIDYGSHTQGDTPGYFETLGKDLSSLPGMVLHPIDTAKSVMGGSFDQAKKALKFMEEGKWSEAGDALPRAIPILGPLAGSIKDDIDAGRFAPALARMTEMFAPKIAEGAKAMVPAAAVDAVKAAADAGGKDVAVGSVKAATGAGGILVGHSLGGETGAVMGTMLGKDLMNAGRKQVAAGVKSAYAAAKDKFSPAEVADPTPNPYSSASTYGPEALAETPAPAPTQTAAPYFPPSSTGPLPAQPLQPPAPVPNPYASTNAPGALVSPAIAPPAAPVEVPANPYFTGAGTATPEAAPQAIPAQAGTNQVSLQQAVPASPNSSYASDVAAQIKASADAKDARFADHLASAGKTSADVDSMSIDQYKALHADVPTGKTSKTGKPTKYTVSGDDSKMASRKDALSSLMRTREATAASVKNATALSAKGVTAKAAMSMTPEQLGAADAKGAADVRFQLQKLEAAKP